ncbi:MAG: ABC transporter permease subunit, partial [Eubacteriales bacterium]
MWKKIIKVPPAGSRAGLILTWLFIVGASFLLFLFPHSAVAFLLFMVSILVLYKMPIPANFKVGAAALALGVIMPLVGLRNSFYLDVATQVGIYVALAIGLNMVVGFAGLLDLGYVAFYASGAYLYAVFAT